MSNGSLQSAYAAVRDFRQENKRKRRNLEFPLLPYILLIGGSYFIVKKVKERF